MDVSEGKLRPTVGLRALDRKKQIEESVAGPLPRCLLVAPASAAPPGRLCGWVESTGVRHGGWNVPGMLGAAYLGQECAVVLLAGSLLALE
jgi:hypothetical protein